jgi:hypothetical protein
VIWVALILMGWLMWVVAEPLLYIRRGTGQCRASMVGTDVDDPTAGRVYRCKYVVGHNGKHRAENGPMW